ncbi:MAG: hypothetical protein RLZZ308_50 [Candidatus Parcubacteria bacterium]|jgi:hypothetical protein
MKKYVPIIIGIVALCALLYVGNSVMKKRQQVSADEQLTLITGVPFSGKVIRLFEGENVLEYAFSIPESATTTVEKDGALVKVSEDTTLLTAMYFSYEGGRGYSSADYINNIIIPNVKDAQVVGTTTIGAYDFDVVESSMSMWRVARVGDGSWLAVIENRKDVDEKAITLIRGFTTK